MAELKENKRNEKFIETLINVTLNIFKIRKKRHKFLKFPFFLKCFRRYAFSNNIVNEYRRKFKAIDQ